MYDSSLFELPHSLFAVMEGVIDALLVRGDGVSSYEAVRYVAVREEDARGYALYVVFRG